MKTENVDEILNRMKQVFSVHTDKELAKQLGLTKQSIISARSNKRIPDTWLIKVSSIPGTSLDWLKDGKGEMNSRNYSNKEKEYADQIFKLRSELEKCNYDKHLLMQENKQLYNKCIQLQDYIIRMMQNISYAQPRDINPYNEQHRNLLNEADLNRKQSRGIFNPFNYNKEGM